MIFRDISRIILSEMELKKEHDNLMIMFELMPTAMIVVDEHLNIENANQSFLETFSVNQGIVINQTFGDALQCVWSKEKGCGNGFECQFCNFRKELSQLIRNKEIKKNLLLKMTFAGNKYKWLNLNFMPIEINDMSKFIVTLENVTERVLYENEINDAKNASMRLLDNLPLMIYRLDTKQHCIFINETFRSYMRIQNISQFDMIKQRIVQEDVFCFKSALDLCFIENRNLSVKIKIVSPSGEYRNMLALGRCVYDEENNFDGFIGLFLDVHDATLAENNFRMSQKKYQLLFENMESSISYHKMFYNSDGEVEDAMIIEMNGASEKMFNMERERVVNKKLSQFNDDFSVYVRELFSKVKIQKSSIQHHEYYIERIDKWVEISVYSPELDFFALVITDIDYKKKSEIELKQAKVKSEEANRAKSEFLANMSHEIRTPLNGIVGMIDLTMMDTLNHEQKDNLNTAKECVSTLIDIINDVLDFSKIEAGKMELDTGIFDLNALIESTVKVQWAHASEKGLDFDIEYHDIISQNLVGDYKRIKQVLTNLLSNSIKFTDKGKVKVDISETASEYEDGVSLIISVSDTGIGIPIEKQHLLFKSFTQIDGSYTRQYGGTGLGLVLSKQLVEMMSGMIYFQSHENIGSVFTFRVPLKISRYDLIKKNENEIFLKKYKNYKILLVEDDKVNQIVIKKMLELSEFRVDLANDGDDAVGKSDMIKYDLILMDIQMPRMDGIKATQMIRKKGKLNKTTPIVALTAFALKGDEEIFRASGMDGYISKPVNRTHLLKVVDQQITNSNTSLIESITREQRHDDYPLNAEKSSEIEKYLNQFKQLMSEENSVMLEIVAHHLKIQFESINAEELKSLAFKMELEIRKGRYDQLESLYQSIESMFILLKKGGQNEKNINSRR